MIGGKIVGRGERARIQVRSNAERPEREETNLHRLARLTLGSIVLRCLRLAWRGQRKVGEVEFAALRVRADQVRLLGVEERQSLAAGPVRVDAHPAPIHPRRGSYTSVLVLTLRPKETAKDLGFSTPVAEGRTHRDSPFFFGLTSDETTWHAHATERSR